MRIGISFFKSKIARRFFTLFIGCAFLPLAVLVGYSYQRFESQLYEQSMLRMDKDCKIYSLALIDRLVSMVNLIKVTGQYLASDQSTAGVSSTMRNQITTMFDGVGLYNEESGLKTLSGKIDLKPDVNLFNTLLHQKGKPTIYIINHATKNKIVYLLVPFTIAGTQCLFVAQPVSSVLWGVGVNDMLPAMMELAVYDEKGQLITSTQVSPGNTLSAMANRSDAGNYLHLEYKSGGDTYLASGWSLFLKSQFNAQTWTIILSTTRTNILSAMLEFKQTFPLIVLLAFWIVLFLSLFFIRKTLNPLVILQQGIVRVGNKDFQSRVEIESGDEFEQLAESFNVMASQLDKQFSTLAVIDEIDRSILSSLDSSVIIPRSLRMISELFSGEFIMLAQLAPEDPNRLRLTILQGNHRNDINEEFVLLGHEEKETFFTREPFKILSHDIFLPHFLANRTTNNSFLFLPLRTEKHITGALILDSIGFDGKNSMEQIRQARQLADQLGIALTNAHLVSDLERLSHGAVEALARTVDAKSKWTAGHSERVAEIAVKIGEGLNWSEDQLEILLRAGLLHDIGKIGIPLAILDKPNKLEDTEYEEVKTHPILGSKILEPIQAYKDILPLVVQHHERFDGKGYPEGLSGENINIGARILCVADVYDALISQRPYREGWAKENVLVFMRENRGIMFDPCVVDIFLSMDI